MQNTTHNVIAIGDIHGHSNLLMGLLNEINGHVDISTQLVFLGDYIDRGPNSKEVVDILLRLQQERPNTVFLRGNHEQMLLDALDGKNKKVFIENGGVETLKSYGLQSASLIDIPSDHIAFFKELHLTCTFDNFLFVHAGLRPQKPVSSQTQDDLLWIRDDFLECDDIFEYKVVFGHTPFINPHIRHNMIGIDTGAGYGGCLTALMLPSESFITYPQQIAYNVI